MLLRDLARLYAVAVAACGAYALLQLARLAIEGNP